MGMLAWTWSVIRNTVVDRLRWAQKTIYLERYKGAEKFLGATLTQEISI